MAAETPQVLAWISADADGDGKPDTLTLRGDATLLLEWQADRRPSCAWGHRPCCPVRPICSFRPRRAGATSSLAPPKWDVEELARDGDGCPPARAQPTIVYQGPVGPVGRDGEYSQELGLVPAGLLRYQTNPLCDAAMAKTGCSSSATATPQALPRRPNRRCPPRRTRQTGQR